MAIAAKAAAMQRDGADVVSLRIEDGNGAGQAVERASERFRAMPGLEELRRTEDALVVYIREGSQAIAPIVTIANETGLSVLEVTLAQPTLDDVFLRATGRRLEVDADIPDPAARDASEAVA